MIKVKFKNKKILYTNPSKVLIFLYENAPKEILKDYLLEREKKEETISFLRRKFSRLSKENLEKDKLINSLKKKFRKR